MTQFIDPSFLPPTLTSFQGYHLQVFTSGRVKLSLQGEGKHQIQYYGERPKRDREAYARQRLRSYAEAPDHFDRVDALLEQWKRARVFRIHLKGDNNKTADNAHFIATQDASMIWVVFDAILHTWEVPDMLMPPLLTGNGPKTGLPSVFRAYLPSYEHDWQDAHFGEEHYPDGLDYDLLYNWMEQQAGAA